ncbi:SRPBCC domain-containing protein [Bdellovibrio sp. qaytius]|nr:SRPBCC domain-containing protein [Bdellovibrio sp. qaytius]
MERSKTDLVLKIERVISATPAEVYKGWLDPKVKGNPWNMGDKLILNAKLNGFFYWFIHGTPHYGRFTKLDKAKKIQHTWMSPYTEGEESTVTVTFAKKGSDTLMTLVHAGLPNTEKGKAHNEGWNEFLDLFPKHFAKKKKKK